MGVRYRVSDAQAEAVCAVLSGLGRVYAGSVPASRWRLLRPGLPAGWLAVLVTDPSGSPTGVFAVSTAPAAGLREVDGARAAALARLWLRLRAPSEVACCASWSADLPHALDAAPPTSRTVAWDGRAR